MTRNTRRLQRQLGYERRLTFLDIVERVEDAVPASRRRNRSLPPSQPREKANESSSRTSLSPPSSAGLPNARRSRTLLVEQSEVDRSLNVDATQLGAVG